MKLVKVKLTRKQVSEVYAELVRARQLRLQGSPKACLKVSLNESKLREMAQSMNEAVFSPGYSEYLKASEELQKRLGTFVVEGNKSQFVITDIPAFALEAEKLEKEHAAAVKEWAEGQQERERLEEEELEVGLYELSNEEIESFKGMDLGFSSAIGMFLEMREEEADQAGK